MEISPISGVRALPALKGRPSHMELTALSDIEELARTGDETYTPSNGSQASVAEDEVDLIEDAPEEEEPEQADTVPIQTDPGGAISFFA